VDLIIGREHGLQGSGEFVLIGVPGDPVTSAVFAFVADALKR